jgi:hypothetical protein
MANDRYGLRAIGSRRPLGSPLCWPSSWRAAVGDACAAEVYPDGHRRFCHSDPAICGGLAAAAGQLSKAMRVLRQHGQAATGVRVDRPFRLRPPRSVHHDTSLSSIKTPNLHISRLSDPRFSYISISHPDIGAGKCTPFVLLPIQVQFFVSHKPPLTIHP